MLTEGYKESIKYLAENRIDEIVYNADDEHAVVVLSELIKNADEYVHIVCKNMDPKVTEKPDYLNAVKLFLDKESSKELKVLMTDNYKDSFKERKIFKLLEKYPEKVFIKHLGHEIKTSDDTPINWTVSDDRAFRLEKDIENYIAFGNFNAPNFAKKFNGHFEVFFAKGKPFSRTTVNL